MASFGAMLLMAACGSESNPLPSRDDGGSGGTGTAGSRAGTSSAAGNASLAGSAGKGGASAGGNGAAGRAGGGGLAGTAGSSGTQSGGRGGATEAGMAGIAGDGSGNAGGNAGAGGSIEAGAGGSIEAGAGGANRGGAAGAGGSAGGGGAAGTSGGVSGAGGASGYQPCPATDACKIMPFGDSITEGYPLYGGYRTGLFHLALEAGKSITFVGSARNGPTTVDGVAFPMQHEGHGGYTIDNEPSRNANGISPFVGPSMRNYSPHIITLMIGTNDINGNIGVSSAPQRLGALLDSIYAENPDVLVVLAQIVPTRSDSTNQTVSTYNAAMPALVAQRTGQGRHLILVDMYAAFTRDANYKNALLGDNLHPNAAGYERMAETWYDVLEPYLR